MKKILFISSSRADYGLLKPLIKEIDNSKNYNYSIIATGTHLSPKFGNTYIEIEEENYTFWTSQMFFR